MGNVLPQCRHRRLAKLVILIVQPTYLLFCVFFVSHVSPWLAFHSHTNNITQFGTSGVGNWRAFIDTWHDPFACSASLQHRPSRLTPLLDASISGVSHTIPALVSHKAAPRHTCGPTPGTSDRDRENRSEACCRSPSWKGRQSRGLCHDPTEACYDSRQHRPGHIKVRLTLLHLFLLSDYI